MKRKITSLVLCLIPLLSLAESELPTIKSDVLSIEVNTYKAKDIALNAVENYEKRYSKTILSLAHDYFNSIDLTKNDWGDFGSKKKLTFAKKTEEIIQEISIEVPPLYEMLLFKVDDGKYRNSKLLDKTISKQCGRYVRHSVGLNKEILESYIKMSNMTTNKINATLSNSNVVVVSFKCILEKI